ncbi:YchJ family protein [Ideonella oryzae]|uniref:UPF0225 protein M0L44_04390 n=1 Tax=Ideonella oryzae TaxID=2937441 RepID=A0ABT1BID0_9BURK|nr:YchJ family metal-binding protein [Ideonella oryzae]MCO5975965.1 YchJ family metal-binding protein [Ideonella oryzae]
MSLAPDAPCPCGRLSPDTRKAPLLYRDCCGRWHEGPSHLQAPDAESLMRSRYSAYVLGLHDYLRDTWHPDTRPTALAPDEPGLRWLGLEVRRLLQQDDDHAMVEFVARCKLGGRAQRLHECSRFERDAQGHWLYLDGAFPD